MTSDNKAAPPVPPAALTVAEFSQAHGFGRNRFYTLQREGLAPRTFRIGKRVMISVEAARDWREMMERRTAELQAQHAASVPPDKATTQALAQQAAQAAQAARSRSRILALKARKSGH